MVTMRSPGSGIRIDPTVVPLTLARKRSEKGEGIRILKVRAGAARIDRQQQPRTPPRYQDYLIFSGLPGIGDLRAGKCPVGLGDGGF
jgi:hypothetical protein